MAEQQDSLKLGEQSLFGYGVFLILSIEFDGWTQFAHLLLIFKHYVR